MEALARAAGEFLALERIAVVGVSRDSRQAANAVYRKLRASGRTVFAVNPSTERVKGDACYPSIAAIPGRVEGAVVVTPADAAADVVDDCAAAGVRHVWLHQGLGPGSVSAAAIERCRRHRLRAIPGACPMMFCAPIDPGHRCIRFFKRLAGRLPAPLG